MAKTVKTAYILGVLATITYVAAASADVEERYRKSCGICHANGAAGAPKTGDIAAWEPRLSKGLDALVSSVENGLNAMMPKGMCDDCSTEDYQALITYMSAGAVTGNKTGNK